MNKSTVIFIGLLLFSNQASSSNIDIFEPGVITYFNNSTNTFLNEINEVGDIAKAVGTLTHWHPDALPVVEELTFIFDGLEVTSSTSTSIDFKDDTGYLKIYRDSSLNFSVFDSSTITDGELWLDLEVVRASSREGFTDAGYAIDIYLNVIGGQLADVFDTNLAADGTDIYFGVGGRDRFIDNAGDFKFIKSTLMYGITPKIPEPSTLILMVFIIFLLAMTSNALKFKRLIL